MAEVKVTIRSAGILNILFTSRGQYISGCSFKKLRLWIIDTKRERKNELNRVAVKIASFNMRTWFRGPLLPSRPSLKIKKSKVRYLLFSTWLFRIWSQIDEKGWLILRCFKCSMSLRNLHAAKSLFWATVWRKNKKQKKLQWKLNRTDDKIDFWRQTETNPRRAVAWSNDTYR